MFEVKRVNSNDKWDKKHLVQNPWETISIKNDQNGLNDKSHTHTTHEIKL